jgi:hypothetical protein
MANNFNRQTQHRPPKETISGKDVAELKKQLRQARRMISRLQKDLTYYKAKLGEDLIPEQPPEPETPPEPEPPKSICCGSLDFTEIILPSSKVLSICNSCGYRLTRIPE